MSTETITSLVAEMRERAFVHGERGIATDIVKWADRLEALEAGVDWRALYRFERAMRFMDNKAALTRDDAYRMADEDIAGMEFHARQTGESPDRSDAAAQRQEQEGGSRG